MVGGGAFTIKASIKVKRVAALAGMVTVVAVVVVAAVAVAKAGAGVVVAVAVVAEVVALAATGAREEGLAMSALSTLVCSVCSCLILSALSKVCSSRRCIKPLVSIPYALSTTVDSLGGRGATVSITKLLLLTPISCAK
jgi:hypothetical protein